MSQVQLDLLDPLDPQENMEKDCLGHRDHLDHPDLLATLHLANLALQVDLANLAPQVHLDQKETLVHLVLKVPGACLALLVAQDPKVSLPPANPDQQVFQDQLDQGESQVLKDIQVTLVHKGRKEREALVFRDLLVSPVQQVRQVLQGSPVSLALEDLAQLDLPVNQENQAHLVVMGSVDQWE